ncbi:hypothetical protein CYMTET_36890 [Cymbomonas tetramitiformis]|uniref:Uncharacterized protein n=1 Tax=Cymbomonas tetramitiformis TaxID=36881 RepID=A0AAE0CGC3_9CHLO|nr:hypothetical protein CYMTET_36890 [Cymbomonas tetramitiformis]
MLCNNYSDNSDSEGTTGMSSFCEGATYGHPDAALALSTDVTVKMYPTDFTVNDNPSFGVDSETPCEHSDSKMSNPSADEAKVVDSDGQKNVFSTVITDEKTLVYACAFLTTMGSYIVAYQVALIADDVGCSSIQAGIIICLLRLFRLVPDGIGICSGGRDHLSYPFLLAISLVLTIIALIVELAGEHVMSLALLCVGCGMSWASTPLNMIVPQLSNASGDSIRRYETLKVSLNRGGSLGEPSPEVKVTVKENALSVPTYVWSCFMTNLMMEFILGVSLVYFSLTWESELGATGILVCSVIPTASLITYAFVELVAWKRIPESVQGWFIFRTPMSHFLPPTFTLLLWMGMGLQGSSLAIIGCAHFVTCFVNGSVQRSAQVNMGTLLMLRPGTEHIVAIREALNTITGAIGGTVGVTLYDQLGQQEMTFYISSFMCTMIVLQLVLAAVHYNQYILKLEHMLEIYEDRMSEVVLKEEPSKIKAARIAKKNRMKSIFTSQQAMDDIEAKVKSLGLD